MSTTSDPLHLLFVLPAAGASGGANSVVQESVELAQLGARVRIAVDRKNHAKFLHNYPDLGRQKVEIAAYGDTAELASLLQTCSIVVATINTTVGEIAKARALVPASARKPAVAYYVQDYEPLFYKQGTPAWQTAFDSYTLIPDAVLFAKTRWLQDVVHENHGVRVAKVRPSIDHGIYFPDLSYGGKTLRISAMLRVSTPRRAPVRTARILNMLAERFGDADVSFTTFGTDARDLAEHGLSLSGRIECFGRLRRHEVPNLLRHTDLFLDLSDYQAFGRTGLEGMSCGVVPIVPVFGGTAEYAQHGRNAYVVDTRDDEAILDAAVSFVAQSPQARAEMQRNALETASEFTVLKAALSELRLFQSIRVG